MPHPIDGLVPDTETIHGWIAAICEQGIRRPGYPADVWAEQWTADRFRIAGLENVRFEPVELKRWEPKTWSLHVAADDGSKSLDLECFPLPWSAPTTETKGQLVATGNGDLTGAVALQTVKLTELPQSFVRERALAWHDPTNEFDTLMQTLPFGTGMQLVMEPAIEAGAVGFIGIFDAPWETCEYYVPYDGIERPIPGVWISRGSGERINALLAGGPATATIVVDSVLEPIQTNNVVGELPGASDEWVVVGSHHDGPWISAVEDASGMGLVLAQATYWGSVPAEDRPHNMLFVVNSGHMVHGAGARAFLDHHPDMLDTIVLAMHLEHTAAECRGVDGKLELTGEPEVGWWFTSRNPDLIASVHDALQTEDVRRAMVVPPELWAPFPTTDGGFFHTVHVPLVDFLAAPMYLFDAQDTLDKIHKPSLVPVTRAAIRILDATAGISAKQMRAGIPSEHLFTATP